MEGISDRQGTFTLAFLTFHQLKRYIQAITERVALYAQAYTLYSSVRPFGISTIFGGVDKTGPSLYVVEPSGVCLVSR